eukprot:TRINITY_DN10719_c0_g1_i1.p1 TRINITY_DN10719_c0_g1~~TRINITY_DN10719_c0_g1_i1.p1  ORF type:complete len:250 (-),score=55.92 TRINITY_DN10719_c0_g1_i1:108-767(-)
MGATQGMCLQASGASTLEEVQLQQQLAFHAGADAHPSQSMAVKKIEDADEFQNQVTPDDIFSSFLCAGKTSRWAQEAFKRREKMISMRSATSEASTATSDSMFGESLWGPISSSSSTQRNELDEEIYKLKDGQIYQGQWSNGMMNGSGVLFGRNGEKYEGSFVHGMKQGVGTLTWDDGRSYVGQFAANRPHGVGQVIGTFGETYECTATRGKIDLTGFN